MADWLDAEGHADRALEMYERGRWAEAEAELRKALALHPDHAEWHFNLGLTLEAAGRDEEALPVYKRAAELLPGQAEPILAAGIVASRLDEFDQAIDLLQKALRIDPRNESGYANLLDAQVRAAHYDDAETTFYLAQQALEEPSASCLAAMGECMLQQKKHDRAGWCFREAIKLNPSMPRIRARLGAVLAATGKSQKALHLYLGDLRDDPGNIDTLLEYGDLLLELGRLPEAAEKFRRILELEPANADAHFRLGQVAMARRRYEQAHVEFELVAKLNADYPTVRLALAEALIARGWRDQAERWLIKELDQLRASDAPDTDLRRLGQLLLDAHRVEDAAAILELAVVASPGNTDAETWRKLALARFRLGRRDDGVAASRRVHRLDPQCIVSIHNLALAALEQGRLNIAAGWIERGFVIDAHDDGLRRLRVRLWLAFIPAGWRYLLSRITRR